MQGKRGNLKLQVEDNETKERSDHSYRNKGRANGNRNPQVQVSMTISYHDSEITQIKDSGLVANGSLEE